MTDAEVWAPLQTDRRRGVVKTTLSFPEQYRELKGDMALPDWQIARKLGLRLEALERKLRRYKLPVSRALSEMVDDERVRRRELKAAS